MKSPISRSLLAIVLLAGVLLASGCAKKALEQPPSPAAPPPVPTHTTPPAPTPTPPSTPTPVVAPTGVSVSDLQPAFFDYDSSTLRDDARASLDRDARILRENSSMSLVVEGHCDERGTVEYNQSLGERRAQAARDYLVQAGVSATRLRVISYGKERPFSDGHDEAAFAQNRRAHFSAQ